MDAEHGELMSMLVAADRGHNVGWETGEFGWGLSGERMETVCLEAGRAPLCLRHLPPLARGGERISGDEKSGVSVRAGAAVDVVDASGDVGGVVAGEEGDHGGDFLGFSVAFHRG